MDRQLKQRVVGAGLLIALGVIFIPIFLDNGGVDSPVPPSDAAVQARSHRARGHIRLDPP